MASTSGTYNFSSTFSTGSVIQQAFALIGVPFAGIDRDHMHNARQQLNLLASGWGNTGPNLWAVDSQSIPLVAGTSNYTVDPATLTILDAWITASSVDRIITSISRSDYAGLPNKAQTGYPTSFWYEPKISQDLYVWPVPDTLTTYTLNFYRARQTQDMITQGGVLPEMPFRWLDALVWSLAERLAFIYAPDRIPVVGARAMKAYQDAAKQDTENVPMTISLDFTRYAI